jgi:hypothetical protein
MAILGLPNDHKERTRSLILILLFSISVSSFPCSRLVPPTCWSSTSIARWTRLTSRPFPYCTTLFLHSAISLLPSIPLDVDIPTPISRHPQSPIPKKTKKNKKRASTPSTPTPALHRNTLHVDVDRRTARSSTSPSRTSLLRLRSLRPIRS